MLSEEERKKLAKDVELIRLEISEWLNAKAKTCAIAIKLLKLLKLLFVQEIFNFRLKVVYAY